MRDYRTLPMWNRVTENDWTDWHWQLQNVITTTSELEQVIHISDEERLGIDEATRYLKMRISPFVASLMDPDDSTDPLRLQFIPSGKEVISLDDSNLFSDVNADERFSPVKGLVHRYPTKVLIFPSNYCSAYCRYCFRRKLVREVETTMSRTELQDAFDYIERHPSIEEVILSGGDPLVLSDDNLEFILSSVCRIPTVQIVRLHTRMPVTIPYRITPRLISILKRYKPLYFVIHVDTAREITFPLQSAIATLVDNGIPCFASCPLLKGINDDETILRTLWTDLLKIRVKPYYLFHSDPVKGLKHFIVPMSRGLEIMRNLYDRMSGLAMPHYCFNVPDGGGHVLLNYNYVTKIGEGRYLIKNFEGEQVEYDESIETDHPLL